MKYVLDCSVTMTWLYQSEATQDTDALLDELLGESQALVAQHWKLELCNVLLGAERIKKHTAAQTTQYLALIDKLPIETDPETERYATSAILAIGRKHQLTSYDAAYLELSIRRGLPLATLDSALRRAARAEGVSLLPAH